MALHYSIAHDGAVPGPVQCAMCMHEAAIEQAGHGMTEKTNITSPRRAGGQQEHAAAIMTDCHEMSECHAHWSLLHGWAAKRVNGPLDYCSTLRAHWCRWTLVGSHTPTRRLNPCRPRPITSPAPRFAPHRTSSHLPSQKPRRPIAAPIGPYFSPERTTPEFSRRRKSTRVCLQLTCCPPACGLPSPPPCVSVCVSVCVRACMRREEDVQQAAPPRRRRRASDIRRAAGLELPIGA